MSFYNLYNRILNESSVNTEVRGFSLANVVSAYLKGYSKHSYNNPSFLDYDVLFNLKLQEILNIIKTNKITINDLINIAKEEIIKEIKKLEGLDIGDKSATALARWVIYQKIKIWNVKETNLVKIAESGVFREISIIIDCTFNKSRNIIGHESLSEREIQSAVKNLKDYIKSYAALIVSELNFGIVISPNHKITFASFVIKEDNEFDKHFLERLNSVDYDYHKLLKNIYEYVEFLRKNKKAMQLDKSSIFNISSDLTINPNFGET